MGSGVRVMVCWLAATSVLAGCTSDDVSGPQASDVDAANLDDAGSASPQPDATLREDAGEDATPVPDATPTLEAEVDSSPEPTPDAASDAMTDAPSDAVADASDAATEASACGDGGPVGTFFDDFSQGIRPTYWTIEESSPDAGIFGYTDDAGAVKFVKVGTSPGGTQNIFASLDMTAIGGPVRGDFTMTVDLRDAVLGPVGGNIDQIELHANFEDASYFFDVYTNEGALEFHVWDGTFRTGFNTSATAATLEIVRVGATLTAYAITPGDAGGDGGAQVIFSESGSTSPLTSASFFLQNFNGDDAISVTYDNFSLKGECVHP